MPLGVVVRLDENPFSKPVFVAGDEAAHPADAGVIEEEAELPEGLVFVRPEESTWTY